jgi:hypothetical protein
MCIVVPNLDACIKDRWFTKGQFNYETFYKVIEDVEFLMTTVEAF